MHCFQPCPIEMWEFNPFTKIGKEWALVTAGTKDKTNCMTISWGGVGVLWGKNVVYMFLRDSRYTKELIDNSDFFSISFLDENYRDAMNYCGTHSGRNEDKIRNAGLTIGRKLGIPYIDESEILLLCHKLSATKITRESFVNQEINDTWYSDGDMHTMYVAEIMDILAR